MNKIFLSLTAIVLLLCVSCRKDEVFQESTKTINERQNVISDTNDSSYFFLEQYAMAADIESIDNTVENKYTVTFEGSSNSFYIEFTTFSYDDSIIAEVSFQSHTQEFFIDIDDDIWQIDGGTENTLADHENDFDLNNNSVQSKVFHVALIHHGLAPNTSAAFGSGIGDDDISARKWFGKIVTEGPCNFNYQWVTTDYYFLGIKVHEKNEQEPC